MKRFKLFSSATNEFNQPMWPKALRGVGGIILNAEGKRFCNELGRWGRPIFAAGEFCRLLIGGA